MNIKTRNSNYVIDLTQRTITGGIFLGRKVPFSSIQMTPGAPAVFTLTDGDIVRTSTVYEIVA